MGFSIKEIIHALIWCKRHLTGQQRVSEMSTFRQFVQEGDICFDVGAHAGSWTRPLSRTVRKGHVYAFEALPYYARVLKIVVNLLRLTNVTVIDKAVFNKHTTVSLAWKGHDGKRLTGTTRIAVGNENMECITVEAITLDSLLPSMPVGSKISFIKIDVEGAELMVASGAVRLIEAFRPIFYLEIVTSYCERYGYAPENLFRFFADFGYKAYTVSQSDAEVVVCVTGPASYPGKGNVLFVPSEHVFCQARRSAKMAGERLTIALVQRYVPHYKLAHYRKLVMSSKYNWEFLYGAHPGRGESGLETMSHNVLPTRPIRNLQIGKVVWQRDVTRWLKEQRYKAVVFDLGWPIISNAALLLTAHRCGIAAIPWSKGISESGKPRPAWRRLIESVFIRQCQAVIAYGQVSADYFVERGYPTERIFIAQNTVDVNEIVKNIPTAQVRATQLRAHLGLDKKIVVGYLGRLVPQKKIDLIIEAFSRAKDRGLDGHLVVAGDGPEREALESMARRSSASHSIHFCGKIPEHEQDAYFQLFDIFVSAYSAGLAILEAMAHGKIVLTTPEARPETELIDDSVTGFVTRDFSVPSLVEGLLLAASSLQNGEEVGRQAQAIVLSRATIENMVEMVDRAVDCALEGKRLS